MSAFAHTEPGTRWPVATVTTTASQEGSGWTITGVKNPVLQGDSAHVVIVSAALPGGGTGLFLVDAESAGVSRSTYATHDGRRGAQFTFTDAAAEPLGEGGDVTAAIVEAEVRAQAALCAESIGIMTEALRLTTEYLKQRKQFGVPLAKFQTLTHRAADMYVALELASSMSLYATMAIADGVIDPTIASRAKLSVGRAAHQIGQEAIQMHGGIGMTAEYPVGHYVSRLVAIEHTLGASDDHLRVLAAGVSVGTAATAVADGSTVDITMTDIAYDAAAVQVPKGSTVEFRFTNDGKVPHDAFVGDQAAQALDVVLQRLHALEIAQEVFDVGLVNAAMIAAMRLE